VEGEKAILVILSVPTGRHCPLLTFRLNRWTSLSITQPLQLGCWFSESLALLSSGRMRSYTWRKLPVSSPF